MSRAEAREKDYRYNLNSHLIFGSCLEYFDCQHWYVLLNLFQVSVDWCQQSISRKICHEQQQQLGTADHWQRWRWHIEERGKQQPEIKRSHQVDPTTRNAPQVWGLQSHGWYHPSTRHWNRRNQTEINLILISSKVTITCYYCHFTSCRCLMIVHNL